MLFVLFASLFISLASIEAKDSFNIKDLDRSIRPGDDFFAFVNSRWYNETEIPSSQTEWGGLPQIIYENKFKLKEILEDLLANVSLANSSEYSVERQLTDFYQAAMNISAINQAGVEPVRSTLVELQAARTAQELIDFVLRWYKQMNEGLLFNFLIVPDDRNSSINIVHWKQTGLGLPNRGYYFLNDSNSLEIQKNYTLYIHRMLTLSDSVLNMTSSLHDAEEVYELERLLAKSHETMVEVQDQEENYHRLSLTEVEKSMPNLNWARIIADLTLDPRLMIFQQIDYYRALDQLIVNQSLKVWKNKIRFTLIHQIAKYLSKDFAEAQFSMYKQMITGQEEPQARWMTIIDFINSNVGQFFGQVFVTRYFSGKSKEYLTNLCENLRQVYRDRVQRASWLSQPTKRQAIEKLNSMILEIGYPDTWNSLREILIERHSFFNSLRNIFQYNFQSRVKLLGSTVFRTQWSAAPQIVTGSYFQTLNKLVVTAAMAQKPFFALDQDDALNYASIGYILAHELTHSLDTRGRPYDPYGNIRPWWNKEEINTFESRAQKLVEQFNSYRVLDRHINGELTLAENIADLGGLEIAYEAFQRTKQAKEGRKIDGFTPEQRFLLAFARTWRVKTTDEKLLYNLQQDSHAPARFRVNGPLSNMKSFYKIFHVTKKDKMYREAKDRVCIW